MISKSMKEYLKTIYVLRTKNSKVRVTDIAEQLNCSKASVNKAINNLKNNKLINYETYGTIELTKDGEELAKKILETYDIVYLFLKDILNLDRKTAESEAEKIKSVINDDTIKELTKFTYKELGFDELNCNYDISKEKCRECAKKRKIKVRSIMEERK